MEPMGQGWLKAAAILIAAFLAGLALGGDGEKKKLSPEERAAIQAAAREKMKQVRREVKQLDLYDAVAKVPSIVAREKEYRALLDRIATTPADETLLRQAYQMKVAALADLNEILKVHRGAHVGIAEEEVRRRLETARFEGIRYEQEWLVNILDDLEDAVRINVELDARVYKFDRVTFNFERTTALAMLQTMADNLQFRYIIRGDTLYVYKERYEVLFDDEWLRQKKAAWKARQLQRQREADERDREKAGGGAK